MCFVWSWEQTAIISVYRFNWLVFVTETECVYCAVRTGSLYTARFSIQQFYVLPTQLYLCVFLWISEQTAIISLYSINWLVFVTERERVYCAVRTGSLYNARFSIQQFYALPTQLYLCFVWISEQTTIISLYNINWLVFITESECVYCAVRTGSLY